MAIFWGNYGKSGWARTNDPNCDSPVKWHFVRDPGHAFPVLIIHKDQSVSWSDEYGVYSRSGDLKVTSLIDGDADWSHSPIYIKELKHGRVFRADGRSWAFIESPYLNSTHYYGFDYGNLEFTIKPFQKNRFVLEKEVPDVRG